jgi:hypothetical protein
MNSRTIRFAVGLVCVTMCFAAPSALAAPLSSGGVINACVLTKGKKATRGLLRVVPSVKKCKQKKGERPLSWTVAPSTQSGSGATGINGEAGAEVPANQPQRRHAGLLPGAVTCRGG